MENLVDATRAALAAKLAAHGLEAMLSTEETALALRVSRKTLWQWACDEDGPLRPVRMGRRLGWRVSDVLALQQGGAK